MQRHQLFVALLSFAGFIATIRTRRALLHRASWPATIKTQSAAVSVMSVFPHAWSVSCLRLVLTADGTKKPWTRRGIPVFILLLQLFLRARAALPPHGARVSSAHLAWHRRLTVSATLLSTRFTQPLLAFLWSFGPLARVEWDWLAFASRSFATLRITAFPTRVTIFE